MPRGKRNHRCILSGILVIHLILLNRGLLLGNPLVSLILDPHHGAIVQRFRVIRPISVRANRVGWLVDTQFGFWLYHHRPYASLPGRRTRRPGRATSVPTKFAAVKYRGYWFWIDDRDGRPQLTFAFIEILLSLTRR
jgi:hypothetical protein